MKSTATAPVRGAVSRTHRLRISFKGGRQGQRNPTPDQALQIAGDDVAQLGNHIGAFGGRNLTGGDGEESGSQGRRHGARGLAT